MQYKGMLAELAPEIVKTSLGRQTNADVAEFIRANFVKGMRSGSNLCYDIDRTKPNFTDYNTEGTFSTEEFFHYANMAIKDNYVKYVREPEMHAADGSGVGYFFRQEEFLMIFRSGVETEAEVLEVIAGIP